jgi:GNAT superfamily N-acetyltransferase
MRLESLTAPVPIKVGHDVRAFNSGVFSLDEWLQKRALKNEKTSVSRTYVTCKENRVVGYYCLSAGAVALREAPKKMTRNMPDPIPVLVMGRLVIDQQYQNKGLGKALLFDASRRTIQAGDIAGVAALLVHALSEEARRFYLSRGFLESPVQPMTLCMRLADAREILASLRGA